MEDTNVSASVLNVFTNSSAEQLAYEWLQRDLRYLGWS
jgi:hypothetical protein